jgi:hypothetical protein
VPYDEYLEDAALENGTMTRPNYILVPIIPDELYHKLAKCLTVEDMGKCYREFHDIDAMTLTSLKVIVQAFFIKVIDDKDVFMPSSIVLWSLDIHNVSDYINKPEHEAALNKCALKDTNYFSTIYGAIGGTVVTNSKLEEYIFMLDSGVRVIETDKESMTIRFVNEYDKQRLGKVHGSGTNNEQTEYRLRPNEYVNIKEYISYVDKENSSNSYKTLLKGFFKAIEVDCWSYENSGYYPRVIGIKFMDEKK